MSEPFRCSNGAQPRVPLGADRQSGAHRVQIDLQQRLLKVAGAARTGEEAAVPEMSRALIPSIELPARSANALA